MRKYTQNIDTFKALVNNKIIYPIVSKYLIA